MSPIFLRFDDLEPPVKRRKVVADDERPEVTLASQSVRTAKVTLANLPQEYQLAKLIADLENIDDSWCTETPACEWSDVDCDEDEKISNISWSEYDLVGKIHLEYLPLSLEGFAARANELSGTVPMDQLPPDLDTLILMYNILDGELDMTSLPKNLVGLYLSQNQFTGNVCLTRLPVGMKYIYLNHNHLTGALDLSLLPPKMRTLSLANNSFSGALDLSQLPLTIGGICLQENTFSGHVELTRLPCGLKTLDLSNNTGLYGEVKKSQLPQYIRPDFLTSETGINVT